MIRRPAAVLASLLLLVPIASAVPALASGPAVTMTDLGALYPGGTRGVAMAINAGGQVVGWSDASFNAKHAFSWSAGVMTDLGTLGGTTSDVRAVSETGLVVGSSDLAGNNRSHGFVWSGGVMTDLGSPGGGNSAAIGVNDSGTVVGVTGVPNGQQQAFSWSSGTMTELVGIPGGTLSSASKVNNAGLIIGAAWDASQNAHAVVWEAGVITDLTPGVVSGVADLNQAGLVVGQVADGQDGYDAFSWTRAGGLVDLGPATQLATAVNDAGQIVGVMDDGGAFFRPVGGPLVILPTLGGNSVWPSDVSASGQVVGYTNAVFAHAFSWTVGGGIVDLGYLPTSGNQASFAFAINDSNQIVGASTSRKVTNDSQPTLWQVGPATDADTDGDGIADSVDVQPGNPSTAFADAAGTSGSVTSPGGLTVTIGDSLDPGGVRVSTTAGTGPAVLSACSFVIQVAQSTSVVVTCGSISLAVETGSARVVFGGGLTVIAVPAGGAVTVADAGGGAYSVTNIGPVAVSLTVDGTTASIAPGASTTARAWDFVGFSQPIDNLPTLNRVNAGQAIPVKWRLLDGVGHPITNLSFASITVTTLSCSLGTTVDQIEEVAAGGSGLQNLGNGYYQVNWKSPKAYASSCKTMHLDLHDGVTHDARFQFPK